MPGLRARARALPTIYGPAVFRARIAGRYLAIMAVVTRPPSPPTPIPPSTPAWSRPDDATRQAQLDAMKRRATGLLVFAALVFGAAAYFESAYPWLAYVRATAEASLVGVLADWFAVTALFRRPLSLPTPHTAIL